ncbi:membrane protein [Bacillus vallismortis]|uniref:membrane protein n=1 Tax=Bacillus vallismortis TaxID=72361 RepID=UPI00028833E8|nr:membrane protein [Bacillus vallismortis]MBG9770634.1 membrane protein [Bacillus vallismortis]MEC1267939.1 hypothetical protein [Bacillus vallismortis]QAV10805.1 hypothetical protein BV11031_20790 [Bacillus vallismortis]
MAYFFTYRLLKSKTLYFSLISSTLIVLYQYLNIAVFDNHSNLPYEVHKSPFLSNILQGNSVIPSTVWLMILPILATLPIASLYRFDVNSGYFMNTIMKTTKGKYFNTLIVFNFLCSFFVIIIPLSINLYLFMMTYPSIKPDGIINYMQNVVSNGSDLANIYYEHPLLYTLILILINGLYGAVLSTIGLSFSFFIKKTYFVYIIPFVVNLIGITILNPDYNPQRYIISNNGFFNLKIFSLLNLGIIILGLLIFLWGKKRRVLL